MADEIHLPRHIGIVMDGNGRWAKERGLPRVLGHQAGIKALERTIDAADVIGVKYISFYAFSTENWKRPKGEVLGIMGLVKYYLSGKIDNIAARNGRLRFVGRIADLAPDIREIIDSAEKRTADNDGIQLIICLNYGGRQEILDAMSRAIEAGKTELSSEDDLRPFMYAPDIPDPDLLIRTGGELRMSNFWLWEGAYSEYYFSDLYWPDFGEEELKKAIESYSKRERRYGTA